MRELVKPGLLLHHSLRSFNSWSSDSGCSLASPAITLGRCRLLQFQWSGAELEHMQGCWSLPRALHRDFTAGFACRSCRSLSEFWQFCIVMMTYSATSEPLAPSCPKKCWIISWVAPVCLPNSGFTLLWLCKLDKIIKNPYKSVLGNRNFS